METLSRVYSHLCHCIHLSPSCNATCAAKSQAQIIVWVGNFSPISRVAPSNFNDTVPRVNELRHTVRAPRGRQVPLQPRDRRCRADNGTRDSMTTSTSKGVTRRGLLRAFAATTLVAAPTYSNAFSLLRGAGDIRKISMHSGRTGEQIDTIYWIDGEYIPEALKEVNRFMRDWRTDSAISMDRRTIDILAASHRMLDTDTPYLLLSGYRSPKTNALLRSKSRSVARNSLHMKGQAADIRIQGRSVTQVSSAAIACSAGGVGRYSRSNFVHMDCGPIRVWGR